MPADQQAILPGVQERLMSQKMPVPRKILLLGCMLFIAAASSYVTFYIMLNYFPKTYALKMMVTKEPLLIDSEYPDDNYYVLPRGTVLYYVDGMAEGHQLYITYFDHQGVIQYDEISMEHRFKKTLVAPSWLSDIDAPTLKTICKRFPLSVADVAAAVKANKITGDDLADILRSLPQK
ncbi:MAG: hypothetical protein LBV01_02070 [Deltaproteobacteria bacterium]|jgi:hypothetical protein|nr:hypothetical protein [Deltaproteobacteria bacterium]